MHDTSKWLLDQFAEFGKPLSQALLDALAVVPVLNMLKGHSTLDEVPLGKRNLLGVLRQHTKMLCGGRLLFRGAELPIFDIESYRFAFCLADASQFVADFEDSFNDLRIPLLAGTIAENCVELVVRHSFAVRAIAGHGVDRVGDRDNAR